MREKISFPEFETKLLSFEKDLEKSDSFLVAIKEEQKAFEAIFPDNNVYEGILRKAFILNTNNVCFEIQNIKDPATLQSSIFISAKFCPNIFNEYISRYNERKHMGLVTKINKNLENEYCLLFDNEGNIFLVVPSNISKSEIYSFYSSSNILVLDLPLILSGIIFEQGVTKAKTILEDIVNKNPISTIANIYAYVKEHKKEILELSPKMEDLSKTISSAILRGERKNSEIRKISKSFMLERPTLSIPYLITRIKDVPVLQLDINSDKISSYRFREVGSDFPVLMVPDGNNISPYFMDETTFKKFFEGEEKNNFSTILENHKGLLSFDGKIQEFCENTEKIAELNYKSLDEGIWYQKDEVEHLKSYLNSFDQFDLLTKNIEEDIKDAKKNAKKELRENVDLVISAFNKHLEKISKDNLITIQEKLLASQKRTNKQCKRKIVEISKILGKIYQHEILLSNL